jgi:hypothetical protein
VVFVAAIAGGARLLGASWEEAVWGTLGMLALSAVGSFFHWLLTWRPERRDGGSAPDPDVPP